MVSKLKFITNDSKVHLEEREGTELGCADKELFQILEQLMFQSQPWFTSEVIWRFVLIRI